MFVAGQNVTVAVRLLDKFGNVAAGNLLNLTGQINGGGHFTGMNAGDQTQTQTVTD